MKVKPSQLHKLKCLKHNKTSNGISYEEDQYEPIEPFYVELQQSDNKVNMIHFEKPVTMITVSTLITINTTLITFTLTDTSITIRCEYLDYYTLIIYRM